MRSLKLLNFLLIFLLGILAHGVSLYNGFTFDDLIHIRDNQNLRLSDFGLGVLTNPAFPGNLYRPLTFLSYYLEINLFGEQPFSFHLINLLIHISVSCLIFALFFNLLGPISALYLSALFVAHPLHVEAVANISGRAELLAAFFSLSALYVLAFSANKPVKGLVLLILSFFAAVSKESGLALLPLAALISFFLNKEDKSYVLKNILYISFGVALYLLLRCYALGGTLYSAHPIDPHDNPLAALNIWQRILEALSLLSFYIQKIFYPLPLSADYSYKVFSFETISNASIASALLTVTLLLFALQKLKNKSLIRFSLLWFFLAFSLTSNIFIPIGTIFAERLAYLPSIGILSLIILTINKFLPSVIIRQSVILILVFSSIIISFKHSSVWKSTEALADYQESVSPESFRTQLLCAARDKNRKDFDSAFKHINQALKILPFNDDAYYLLGAIEIERAELQKAEIALRKAFEINSKHLPTINLYARLLLNTGKLQEAKALANQSLLVKPNNSDGLLVLLALAIKSNDYNSAGEFAERLKAINHQSADFDQLLKTLAALTNK